MQISKIEVEQSKLSNIIHDIEHGQLRIPRFQRDFVWERSKVIKLLDSIYKEYPIGSFFIWEANKKYNLFYRNVADLNLPKPDEYSTIRYILDGQQRATSLYVVIKGLTVNRSDYSQICFHLDQEKFVIRYREQDNCVPLRDILDESKHLQIYDKLSSARKRVFEKCRNIFISYPISVINVKEKELNEAIDIFERINQGGRRLSLFDLVVAGTWGEDFDLKANFLNLRDYIDQEYGFGKISPEVVIHAASLILKGYCRKIHQLQIDREELRENWDEIANSIKLSVDYLSNNLGVKIYEFVPYPAMISLLAYLFYKLPGRSLDKVMKEKVDEWFWKAALSDRYAGSRETRMGDDRRLLFDKLLESQEVKINYLISLDKERISKIKISNKSALRSAFFCMLAIRQPRHFKTNALITLDAKICSDFNSAEKHHIFPKQFLKKQQLGSEYLLMNFCFIPAELNKEILNKAPSVYFAKYDKENPEFKEALKTQLINYDDSIKNDDYNLFINNRTDAVFKEFERLMGSKILQIAGQNANRAVDEIEEQLRKLIHAVLLKEVGEKYWKEAIPSDVKDKVNRQTDEYLRKNPFKTKFDISLTDKLSWLDIMHYSNIILKNWAYFEVFFKSKQELEKRFIALKDFRNAVKHNRDIDFILQKDGEAALEWFSNCLKIIKQLDQDQAIKKIIATKKIPLETDEETIARVKSNFVKKAVKAIPEWAKNKLSKNDIFVHPGPFGSDHSLKKGDVLILFYCFSAHWVYCRMGPSTPELVQELMDALSKPDSVLVRDDEHRSVRFKMFNEDDLQVMQRIIEKRANSI